MRNKNPGKQYIPKRKKKNKKKEKIKTIFVYGDKPMDLFFLYPRLL